MTILKPRSISRLLEVKMKPHLHLKWPTILAKSGDEVAAAEATMAFHTVKHHYSYKSDDCTSTLMAKILIFPDSSTAKRYSCARTKIEAIVNKLYCSARPSGLAKYYHQSELYVLITSQLRIKLMNGTAIRRQKICRDPLIRNVRYWKRLVYRSNCF